MATLTKPQIIAKLVKAGAPRARATLYADAFLEYQKATENIDEHGLIVLHPRTGNPIENPYLPIRRAAGKTLAGFRHINADGLW